MLNSCRSKKNNGWTLLEILMVLGIGLLLSILTLSALYRYRQSQALEVNTRLVLHALEEARHNTLDSLNASQYGVRLYVDHIEIFQGNTYSSGGVIDAQTLKDSIVIEEISVGGGSDVIFERLTGETINTGFIIIGDGSATGDDKTIIIEATGLSYVEQ